MLIKPPDFESVHVDLLPVKNHHCTNDSVLKRACFKTCENESASSDQSERRTLRCGGVIRSVICKSSHVFITSPVFPSDASRCLSSLWEFLFHGHGVEIPILPDSTTPLSPRQTRGTRRATLTPPSLNRKIAPLPVDGHKNVQWDYSFSNDSPLKRVIKSHQTLLHRWGLERMR